jgi:hypothetical protein
MTPRSKLIARTALRVMARLDSYKRLMASIEMEYAMCTAYGFPFKLPVDKMYEDCYNESARIVAKHFGCAPGNVLWCVERFLHLPQGPRN